jgi:hypothetical protein
VIAVGATVAVILISQSGSSSSSADFRTAPTQTSGPDEALRGQAAASAVGATPATVGGPDETARGQAVHTAAGASPEPGSGGPDETLRGQSAYSASR